MLKMPIVFTGRCCQDAAKAEGDEEHTEDSSTHRWQKMKLQSVTSIVTDEHDLFVAKLLSLNLSEIIAAWFALHVCYQESCGFMYSFSMTGC